MATGAAAAETTLLHLWLPLIGATLLARLVSAGSIPLSAGLLATLLGFMTLVTGVWLAWIRPAERGGLAAGLSLSLSGLAFLTGIWAGAGPLAAAMRIMVLVSGALLLIEGKRVASPQSKIRNPQLVALAVAFLAIAGLPPTAGFASLAPLVESWLSGGRIVFVLALILLLIPLLTILYRFTQRLARQSLATDHESARPAPDNRFILNEFAPLLLVAGTLSLGGYSFDAATIGTWLALFVVAFGSLLLPHFLRQLDSLRAALREALTFRPLQGRLSVSLHRLVTQATDAVAEAYAILEGDTGLLLLLALLLLFWWIS
jgi:hypothetical protein